MSLSNPTLYRAGLVRLPLQQATFDGVAAAGRRLGLPEELGWDVGARLDPQGNLYLDPEQGRRLGRALVDRLTEDRAEALMASLESAGASLGERKGPPPELRDLPLADLGDHLARVARGMATLIDFALLGRFVPDALMEGLTRAGDRRPPPFPSPSSGSGLARDLLHLYQSLTSDGGRLAGLLRPETPLDHQVERQVRAFADHHVGFGPLAWDRPGFEDPGHVLTAMVVAFEGGGAKIGEADRPWGPAELPTADSHSTSALGTFPVEAGRRLLASWLAFLDEETWRVRRAFYLRMVPILREVVSVHRRDVPELRAGDVLFCTSALEPAADPSGWLTEAQARRVAYLGQRRADADHVVDDRLDAMVERPWGPA